MIKITFTHSVKPEGPATDISIVEEVSREIYDHMYARLKQFVEQNVILNCVILIKENNQIIVSHFATTPENAELFLSAYIEPVAFWEPYGIDWKLDQEEIDFDTVNTATTITLFDDSDFLYGLSN